MEETKDKNGTVLQAGDQVKVTQTVPVKGSSNRIQVGTVIKNIRLTGDPDYIEGKVDKLGVMMVKTIYVQKIG